MSYLLLGLIRVYQHCVSPVLGTNCRFVPTCSTYAYKAIKRFGSLTGGVLALKRILRCHPFCQGGYDPVPKRKMGAFLARR